jgi:hypothetical protein
MLWKQRLKDERPFDFVLLTLEDGNPALLNCLEITRAGEHAPRADKDHIESLKMLRAASPNPDSKKLEFLKWNGHGPGSIVWWIANGNEHIGLGCWLQCPGNTDGTPWVVLQQGPFFDSLKLHCKNTIAKADASGRR